MMTSPLVLTFDLGTQSCRAALIDKKGNTLHIVQQRYEQLYFSKGPDWAEQYAEFYFSTLCDISQKLKLKSGALWNDVAAMTLTTIRDSCVCLDKDGKPLRPVILWLDKRESSTGDALPMINYAAFAVSGMAKSVELSRRVSACNWIRQNEPEIWAKTDKYLMLSGYIILKLSGNCIDSDASIIGHVPFDCKNRRWMTSRDLTYCVFPVEKDKLCKVAPPGAVAGHVTREAAELSGIREGLPIILAGSDKGCESIGMSCLSPEKASVSFGTTATVQYTIDRYVEPQPFMPAYPAAVSGKWNPEIQIYRGYWLVSWFKQEFGESELRQSEKDGVSAEELLNRRLTEIPPGCDGLMLQPYFTAGVTMPNARGSLIGFSDVHTRLHIYRAIIEGLNYALLEGMEALQKRMKCETREVFLAGGGSMSDEICRITADMFGLPCFRTQTHEAAIIGSAMIAFTALGVFSNIDEASANMVHIKDSFIPDAKNHELYRKLYENIYSKVFTRLQPLYEIYSQITKK